MKTLKDIKKDALKYSMLTGKRLTREQEKMLRMNVRNIKQILKEEDLE